MSFAKVPVSMLIASVFALTAACSRSIAPPPEAPPEALAAENLPPAAVPTPLSTQSIPSAALPAAPANEPAVRKSPMQALNQMVTAQAMLVSLLLAPFSREAAEQPLARVDAPRGSAPRR